MDPPKPPKLTRPTMNRSSFELKQEITENLRFLQRQMEIHYGHRKTFRSDATLQFLAKVVGQTRQLREQWTRYIELDSTIPEEFPIRFQHRQQTSEEKNENAIRRDDLIPRPKQQNERATKIEEAQQKKQTQEKTVMKTGAKPKEAKEKPDLIPKNDETHDSRRPRQENMWAQRTTTTIFDGSYRPKRLNKQTQEASASYIQEQSPRKNKPPTIVHDMSCDKIVNGRQCRFRPYYDCPKHYPALSKILKEMNGEHVKDKNEQEY